MKTVPVLKHVPGVNKMSRREFFFGVAGAVVGGAAATATGLGAYSYLKARGYQATRTGLNEAITAQDGWMITMEDRSKLAALQVNKDEIVTNDAFEFVERSNIGGEDIKSFRATSFGECVEACQADTACQKFTYATSKHDSSDERQMCRLKDSSNAKTVENATNYISGRRR